ncbi:MAG: hypothetical protein KME08_16845 [Aphanothece sp. CMT-3BRIN-NPC111]|nr:hypothetical protein [Aphanothece sp. CMT-3BRIN-NPC111]
MLAFANVALNRDRSELLMLVIINKFQQAQAIPLSIRLAYNFLTSSGLRHFYGGMKTDGEIGGTA